MNNLVANRYTQGTDILTVLAQLFNLAKQSPVAVPSGCAERMSGSLQDQLIAASQGWSTPNFQGDDFGVGMPPMYGTEAAPCRGRVIAFPPKTRSQSKAA